MYRLKYISVAGLIISLLSMNGAAQEELRQRRASSQSARDKQVTASLLTGLYRIDLASSDKLYTVVADVSSNLPYREQHRFFIDLAVRLTPPDQFSIEQRGHTISIASSRAPRISFEADGVVHAARAADGHQVFTRAMFSRNQLVVSTEGSSDDKFNVSFEPIDNGQRLRVVRRIYAKELNEPVIIQSIYDKVSEVAHWGIYGEPEVAPHDQPTLTAVGSKTAASAKSIPARSGSSDAAVLSNALEEWLAATNGKNLRKHLSFYMPRLKAFYLARNVPREAVRSERERAFERADLIEVRALAPETIFVEGGRVAIMRFRKKYLTKRGSQKRQGEVIQELRWQRTDQGWKIFSERDVKVLR
jgi:ketosteroid isomerase-like protein